MTDMPPFWLGTSWKMNKTRAEANQFVDGLLAATIDPRIQAFVIPPYTAMYKVKKRLSDTNIKVGAQNMHWETEGAWTGEISPVMLTDCQLDLVELGHSERRTHFGETDETVGLKTEAAIRHGLIPLICIGESAAQKEAGQADQVLRRQVEAALSRLSAAQLAAPILFAYEPIWAIGEKGVPATPEYADARQAKIIDIAANIAGRRLPCLYGGSVNPDNCAELSACSHIDGLFIGRSAWQVEGYLDIIQRCLSVIGK